VGGSEFTLALKSVWQWGSMVFLSISILVGCLILIGNSCTAENSLGLPCLCSQWTAFWAWHVANKVIN